MLDLALFEWLLVGLLIFIILGPEDSAQLFKTLRALWQQGQQWLGALWQAADPSPTLPLSPRVHLALYQPEIPHNTGTLLRLSACLSVPLHIIEPCGFVWSSRHLQRSGMDYINASLHWRHADWQTFRAHVKGQRIILMTTDASLSYRDMVFKPHDIILCGQESCGVPQDIAEQCDGAVVIPMRPPCRSLNMAVAATLVVGEALRQLEEKTA